MSATHVESAPRPSMAPTVRTVAMLPDGELFAHDQVRAFSIVSTLLSWGGIVISIPLWRLLGFLP